MKRLASGLTLVLVATPVWGQDSTELDTGSHIPVPRRARIVSSNLSQADNNRVTMSDFAKCVVARNPVAVARGLPIMIKGEQRQNILSGLATPQCLEDGQMSVPPRLMRGALFVELYRLYALRKKVIFAPAPLQLDEPLLPENRADPVEAGLLAFGDCVVKRDEVTARHVVVSPTASAEQNAAFKVLIPNLGPCLIAGQKITFSKPIIEGVLAEVLYREALSPIVQAGTK